METRGLFTQPAPKQSRQLFIAALAIFTVTVTIGVLNGTGAVHFEHDALLTHVHAGTLGWITLAVFAVVIWLFAGEEGPGKSAGWVTWLSIASIAIYIVTFWLGAKTGMLRPVVGTLVLVAVAAVFFYALGMRRSITMTVAHFGLLISLITLFVGSIFGVLLGLKLAGKLGSLPDAIAPSHPATQVIGYLILAAVSIIEARLVSEPKAARESKPGIIQNLLLFLASAALSTGLLLNILPITGLNIPLELAAIVIFLIRMKSSIFKVGWLERGPARHLGIAALFLVFDVGITIYLVAVVVGGKDPEQYLLLVLDHAMFVGVMTNALFGMANEASRDRRYVWPWADDAIFWATNLGAIGFVAALFGRSTPVYKVVTPVMGLGILIGIATYLVRMLGTAPEKADDAAEAPEADNDSPEAVSV